MRVVQTERAAEEREMARDSDEEQGTATHERRAQRAEYLQSKLADRARSEDEAEQ